MQKTNAEKVSFYIDKVIDVLKYPADALDISTIELENILKPFGMYKIKTKRIKNCANIILNNYNGNIPEKKKDLLSLPGVGKYIADAVLCFGYGIDRAVVDVNTIRVISRYFGIKSSYSRPRNDPYLYRFIQSLVPKNKCKEFNWGLIDFSATVCKNKPLCNTCILKTNCSYLQTQNNY